MFAEHGQRFATLACSRSFKPPAEMGGPYAAPFDALQTIGTCDFLTGEFWAHNERDRIEDDCRFLWWPSSEAFFAHAARCQVLRQTGLFVADVLHYHGDT